MGFWALRGKGVPVSMIGNEIIYGFNLINIENALIQIGYDIEKEANTQHTDTVTFSSNSYF